MHRYRHFWKMLGVAAGITTTALTIGPAISNDSTAELTTGGLVFTTNKAIVMREERLFISLSVIHVRYVLFNKSDKDIRSTVAFPVPDIELDPPSNVAIPNDDSENILGFTTMADGQYLNARVEQKVFANGVEQTGLLRRLGVPLAPHLESTVTALDSLPRQEWTNLVNLGLATIEVYSTGMYPNAVMKEHLSPRWRLKTTYFWEQTFPAQRELLIEHRYKPSVGSSVVTLVGNTNPELETYAREERKQFCTNDDFVETVRRAPHPFQERRIQYILTTGANWAEPIRNFILIVDKGSPGNLVSFCEQGVKKISPTQFEVRKTNFIPKSELSILILEPTNMH
jgi:hypothetical protein